MTLCSEPAIGKELLPQLYRESPSKNRRFASAVSMKWPINSSPGAKNTSCLLDGMQSEGSSQCFQKGLSDLRLKKVQLLGHLANELLSQTTGLGKLGNTR